MALSANQQLRWWGAGLIALFLAIWLLKDVLFPFVVACAIAYLLDPIADRLESAGIPRALASVFIIVLTILFFVTAGLLVVPVLLLQFSSLVDALPSILEGLQTFLRERLPGDIGDLGTILKRSLNVLGDLVRSQGMALMGTLVASVQGAINAAVFVVIVPVVAFYLLLDWNRLVAKIDGWLPRDHADTIRRLGGEVDEVLAGFVRGQITVCAILAAFYAVMLSLVGLQFGIIVGFLAGMLSFIPFVGSVGGGLLSIGLATFQFWDDPLLILAVAMIFFAGQLFEQYFLTPKLVGNSIKLHPAWLLFALSAFGSLYGFVGMLVAVPAAAALGVFFRFGVSQYLHGKLFKGRSESG
ncbi:MAG: AI-2E family transporter [Albidovulum sp.]|nr:AI-2E family transporter [Albidovulum sp.]MDE0533584.1 AI-2E family transporter [Albidovulum sp.]